MQKYNFSSPKKRKRVLTTIGLTLAAGTVIDTGIALSAHSESIRPANVDVGSGAIMQRLKTTPFKMSDGRYYVPAALNTMQWGLLPNRNSKPILTVPSGTVITFDTLSCEGMVEDQGRDPVKFLGQYGVRPNEVLEDAIEICASNVKHDPKTDGPHIIIGPIAIEGAQPGDVLKVDTLDLEPRVPYGIVSSRHGKGVLVGEYPQNDGPRPGASQEHPLLYGNVFTFIPIKNVDGKSYGIVHTVSNKDVKFPLHPFMGTMGVGADTTAKVNSIPPSSFGGNLDCKDLTVGSSLYLPIQLPQAMFFTGDPHFSQGDGEVALTAVEGSLRSTLRLTLLKAGDPAIPCKGTLKEPFAETPDNWIAIGLDPDLDDATKNAVRAAIKFLVDKMDMDNATAYAYLSAAADFHVTQAVDETKGVHAHIAKKDFSALAPASK